MLLNRTVPRIVDNITIPSQGIKHEVMFRKSSFGFVSANCGPIVKDFVGTIPEHMRDDAIIDVKVLYLQPGQYPCIPGWHLDAAPRGDNGQPVMQPELYEQSTHMVCHGGIKCSTEFLVQPIDVPEIEDGVVYQQWHEYITKHNPVTTVYDNGAVVEFSGAGFHKGTPATEQGWRIFMRASFNTNRKPVNQIRNQVSVYIVNEGSGW